MQEQPYEFYGALRRDAPVFKLPGRDDYVISRYEDVVWAFEQHDLLSSRVFDEAIGADPNFRVVAERSCAIGPALGQEDPPRHKYHRELAFSLIRPAALRLYRSKIEFIADGLVDSFADRGEVDLMKDFAKPLPMAVIVDILGLEQSRVGDYLRWSDEMTKLLSGFMPEDQVPALQEGAVNLLNCLIAAIASRRETPREDGISVLANYRLEGGELCSVPELVGILSQLVFAGYETIANMISNTMILLLDNANAMDAAEAEASSLRKVLEESLRLESSAQFLTRRATASFELHGVRIPRGARVLLFAAAGNRDEDQFSAADQFVLGRKNISDHLAFGRGIHFCIGAPLARMEGEIAFQTLFRRLRNIRFAEGKNDFTHQHSPIFRGPNALYLNFEAAP